MQYRKLGKTNIEISVVGFGSWAIGGWMWGGSDERKASDALNAALDAGITLIDTAPVYGFGLSEEIVGRTIRERRKNVVIATKCGLIWDREEGEFHFHSDEQGVSMRPSSKKVYKCLRPASIRQEVEASLRRLQTDYIDLYQTHWQEKTTPIADTVAELQKLKEEGKILAFGASNANVEQLKEYGEELSSDQEQFSILDRKMESNGSMAYCRENDVSVLAYSPLANGLLTGKISPDRQFGPGDLRKMNMRFRPENIKKINARLEAIGTIAESHNANIAQTIIAWTIAQPGLTCALCGARDAVQAAENAAAGAIVLTEEEIAQINETVKL